MLRIVVFLLAIGTTLPLREAQPQSGPDSLAARGDSALARNQAQLALAAYDQALRLRPSDALLLQKRGRALRELGQLAEALAAYDAAVTVDTGLAVGYAGRAYTRYLLNQFDTGLVDVAHARARGFDPPELALVAGMLHRRLSHYAESARELDVFVAAVPNVWDGWFNRGLAYMGLNQAAPARRDFDRAEATGLTTPELYFFRGIALGELGDRQAACADLRRAAASGHKEAAARLPKRCP